MPHYSLLLGLKERVSDLITLTMGQHREPVLVVAGVGFLPLLGLVRQSVLPMDQMQIPGKGRGRELLLESPIQDFPSEGGHPQ